MKTSKWFLTSFFPVTLLLLMSTAFLLVMIFKIIFFLASYRTVITVANVTNVFYLSSELNMSHMPLRLRQSGLLVFVLFCFMLETFLSAFVTSPICLTPCGVLILLIPEVAGPEFWLQPFPNLDSLDALIHHHYLLATAVYIISIQTFY